MQRICPLLRSTEAWCIKCTLRRCALLRQKHGASNAPYGARLLLRSITAEARCIKCTLLLRSTMAEARCIKCTLRRCALLWQKHGASNAPYGARLLLRSITAEARCIKCTLRRCALLWQKHGASNAPYGARLLLRSITAEARCIKCTLRRAPAGYHDAAHASACRLNGFSARRIVDRCSTSATMMTR